MKRILVFLLIATLVSGCTPNKPIENLSLQNDVDDENNTAETTDMLNSSNDLINNDTHSSLPPNNIHVTSNEELKELRKMRGAEARELSEYLVRAGHYEGGIRTKRDIDVLFTTLDSLIVPLPPEKGIKIRDMAYIYELQIITYLCYEVEDGSIYSIGFLNSIDTIEDHMKIYEEKEILLYQSEDRQISVYGYPQALERKIEPEARNNSSRFLMDFYGRHIEIAYWNDNIRDMSSVTAEQLCSNLMAGSIAELEARAVLDENTRSDAESAENIEFGEARREE